MNKPLVRVALLGLSAYVLFLLITLPAALVMPKRLPGGAQLQGVNGSIWTGQADGLVWRGQNLGRVEWRFAPFALLRARLGVRFKLKGPELQASGEFLQPWFSKRPEFSGLDLDMDTALSGRLDLPLRIDGDLRAHFEYASWPADGAPNVTGTAQWTDAVAKNPVALRLGAVQADFQPGNAGQGVKLTLQGGDLSGQGSANVDAKANYKLDMNLAAHTAEARELLGLMGHSDARDSLRIDRSGDLRPLLRMAGM
ncbi:MAG: type II secretion system protein N [Gammaproteobacteria bacterium]